jgi:phosphoglycerate kinase
VAALAHAGVEEKMTYVSTAGGAFLEWLEGKTLPGVQILFDRAAVMRGAKAAAAG